MNQISIRSALGFFTLLSCWFISTKTFAQPGGPGFMSGWATMERSLPPHRRLKSVAYGNGIFVAVGPCLTILTSQNGSDWINRSSEITRVIANINFDSETYSAGGDTITFVFVKNGSKSLFQNVHLSYDALPADDSSLKGGTATQTSLLYEPAIKNHPVSRTLEDVPETTKNPSTLRSVGFGAGIFVVVGDGGEILASQNGEHWASTISGISTTLTGVAWGNTGFVVVGDKGIILTSPDGSTWTQRNSGTDQTLFGVAYGNGTFVALGDNSTILTSNDGIRWTPLDIGREAMESIAFGNGFFMGTGIDTDFPGKMYMDSHQTMVSTDGKNWHRVRHPYPSQEGQCGAMTFDGHSGGTTFLTFGGGLFIATSVEGVYTSLDGNCWNPSIEPRGFKSCYYGAAFGNGVFAVVGNGSAISTNHDQTWRETVATSKRADSWQLSKTPPSRLVWGRLINDKTFGAFRPGSGPYAIYLVSTNGETWTTPHKISISGSVYGNEVVYSLGKKPVVLSSKDGIIWTRLLPRNSDQPTPVIASNPLDMTKSENGIVIELNGQSYKLNITADVGQPMEVQASTNLESWVTLTTITNSGEILSFVDRDVTNYPMRFYRLKLQ